MKKNILKTTKYMKTSQNLERKTQRQETKSGKVFINQDYYAM